MIQYLTKDELDRLNELIIRGKDKWSRMYNQGSITILEYSSENITVRVDSNGKVFLRPSERIPLIKRIEEIFTYPVPFVPSQYTVEVYKNAGISGFMVGVDEIVNKDDTGSKPLLQRLIDKLKFSSNTKTNTEEPFTRFTGKFTDTTNIGIRLKK